jgi:hypothetical protein
MGASIYWQPLRGTHLSVGLRSRFIAMMNEAFGNYPWNLTAGHAGELSAMAIGAEDEGIKAALRTLAEAVQQHEQITVWPEY